MIGAYLLSQREKVNPGTIERCTGRMMMCEECCRNYRRMCTDPRLGNVCGTCKVPSVASPSAIPYDAVSPSRED
jgi:hypothetical protein